MKTPRLLALLVGSLATTLCVSAAAAVAPKSPPTFADVRYGEHERNVLDVWLPGGVKPAAPAPLVISIHGGGFRNYDKQAASDPDVIAFCRERGWIFASINYRYAKDGVTVLDAMHDGKRALQFLRHHAARWGLNPKRIAVYGDSAGAGMSLWIGLQDDMADPANADPVLRESTRVSCIGMSNGQITYDRDEARTLLFGHLEIPASLLTPRAERDAGPRISMVKFITVDDPPVYSFSIYPDTVPRDRDHLGHHPRHGMEVKKRYDALGLRSETSISLPTSENGNRDAKIQGRARMMAFFESVMASKQP